MFLIDRLYPEMPPQHREQFRRRFQALLGRRHVARIPATRTAGSAPDDRIDPGRRGADVAAGSVLDPRLSPRGIRSYAGLTGRSRRPVDSTLQACHEPGSTP